MGRANAFKSRIEKYLDYLPYLPVGLAFISRSSTKKFEEEEEVHKHCIGDVKGSANHCIGNLASLAGKVVALSSSLSLTIAD